MTTRQERRRHPRFMRLDWNGPVQARIRPGHDVVVIDLARSGALVETSRRLTPGGTAELQLEALDGRHTTRAAVVRSCVCLLLADQVLFRTALAFERPVPWLSEEALFLVPACQSPPPPAEAVGAVRQPHCSATVSDARVRSQV